jgi:hypothetical protein
MIETPEDRIEAELVAFRKRVREKARELELKGMDPAETDKEARKLIVAENEEKEQKIKDGVPYIMKERAVSLDNCGIKRFMWLELKLIHRLFCNEYSKIQATQSDIEKAVYWLVERNVLEHQYYNDSKKDKFRYKSTEPQKPKAPDRKPINPDDLPDW